MIKRDKPEYLTVGGALVCLEGILCAKQVTELSPYITRLCITYTSGVTITIEPTQYSSVYQMQQQIENKLTEELC